MTDERPLIVHVVWRLSRTGGIQRVVRTILSDLGDSHRHHVISLRPRFAEDAVDELDGVEFTFLDARRPLGLRNRIRLLWAVDRAIRRLQPELIHMHSGTSLVAATAARHVRGRLLEYHDGPSSERASRTTTALTGAQIRLQRLDVLVHSTAVADDVRSVLRIPPSRIHIIPLGVDIERFAPLVAKVREELFARHGWDPDVPLVLWLGRLVPSKDPGAALAVAEHLAEQTNPPTVVVAGSGPLRSELERRVRARPLEGNVTLAGPVNDDELATLLASADVFLTTSHYEGFGLAALEALASGTPVVGWGVGGLTDVVTDGTGVLVDPGRPPVDIADAIRGLLGDRDRLTAMSTSARRRAEQLSTRRMADGFGELYDHLIGGPRAG